MLVVLLGLTGARAQETLGSVNFNNRVLADGVSAPVFDGVVGGPALEGGAFCAQLYGGPAGTPENLLVPAGAIVDFRTGLAAGFVNVGADGTRKIPGVSAGAAAVVQIRAWSTAGGATYEQARANPDPNVKVGRSPPLTLFTESGVLALPVSMVGLQSFAIKHEEMPAPQIRREGNFMVVDWPVDASTYLVEVGNGPARSAAWQTVSAKPDLVAGRYQLRLHMSGTSGFVRLRLR